MEIDSANRDMYREMTTVTVPRPIGWISTVDAEGRDNIAPFSHYNNVCAGSPSPPVVMFSSDIHDETPKDTPRNVLETEEFVVNLVTESLVEQMDTTSDSIAPEESEFDFAGIEREDSVAVSPPRVAESPVNVECTLYDSMRVYNHLVILGDVVHVHIDDALLTDGKVDVHKIDAVGRLGGSRYASVQVHDFERSH